MTYAYPHPRQLIKYGVIRTELLLRDLSEWDTLYVVRSQGRVLSPHIVSRPRRADPNRRKGWPPARNHS